mgnify:FL=1|tara:strand:- start:170 stop:958 length:789 start_codon:yes stop_codon:yes gene_type:complete
MEINKIYNENCLDTMKRMNDNFIDLTVTSPPYDNLRKYNGYSFDFENIAKELYRVTKEGGIVVWIVGDATIKGSETGTSFRQALYFKEIGFNLNDTMIYRKLNYLPVTSCRYEPQFEYMFILSKGKVKTFNPIMKLNKSAGNKGGTHRHNGNDLEKLHTNNGIIKKEGRRTNVWDVACGSMNSKDKISFKHPATFPERLANDHIISWSNEEDIVYDCFMGSGTTAKMCVLNNRKYIGSEISKEYVDIANKRLIIYKSQNKLF